MALKATIFKAMINIADMDRDYYTDLNLTIAQHPSETNKRMMVRLVAYILNAADGLEFTKGLCEDNEPEVWQKNYSGDIELWIDIGRPEDKRLKSACHKAKQVLLYTYGDNAQSEWWKLYSQKVLPLSNLSIFHISDEHLLAAEALVSRTMKIQASIQDGQLWLSTDTLSVLIEPIRIKCN